METPSDTVDARGALRLRSSPWSLLGLVCHSALGTLVLALIQSAPARFDPLDRLKARSATRLGDGDFSLSTPRSSGVPEIDEIRVRRSTAARNASRSTSAPSGSFSEHASHQLRHQR